MVSGLVAILVAIACHSGPWFRGRPRRLTIRWRKPASPGTRCVGQNPKTRVIIRESEIPSN
jgi:hypothetical protein